MRRPGRDKSSSYSAAEGGSVGAYPPPAHGRLLIRPSASAAVVLGDVNDRRCGLGAGHDVTHLLRGRRPVELHKIAWPAGAAIGCASRLR